MDSRDYRDLPDIYLSSRIAEKSLKEQIAHLEPVQDFYLGELWRARKGSNRYKSALEGFRSINKIIVGMESDIECLQQFRKAYRNGGLS